MNKALVTGVLLLAAAGIATTTGCGSHPDSVDPSNGKAPEVAPGEVDVASGVGGGSCQYYGCAATGNPCTKYACVEYSGVYRCQLEGVPVGTVCQEPSAGITNGVCSAGTCSAAAQEPSGGLLGASNYTLASSNCADLLDVTVTIAITQDLVGGPGNCGGPNGAGFAFQLNANSATSASGFEWQQYILGIDGPGTEIVGAVNNWTAADLASNNTLLWQTPAQNVAPLATGLRIPAGYQLQFNLTNTGDNVSAVTFVVTDASGVRHTLIQNLNAFSPPAGALAPIKALQLELVGAGDACHTTFLSGAGTITYSAVSAPLTALPSIPSCAVPTVTGEGSNAIYDLLPAGSSTSLVQAFHF